MIRRPLISSSHIGSFPLMRRSSSTWPASTGLWRLDTSVPTARQQDLCGTVLFRRSTGAGPIAHGEATIWKYLCRQSHRRRSNSTNRHPVSLGGKLLDERGLRLTFDMQLQGRTHALAVDQLARNAHFLPMDWFVMEAKLMNVFRIG